MILYVTLVFQQHSSLSRWRVTGIWFSVHLSVRQSVNICVNPIFNLNVRVHFPRTIKATMMILGINLHLGIATQTAVSIFDLDLYIMVHQL